MVAIYVAKPLAITLLLLLDLLWQVGNSSKKHFIKKPENSS